MVACRLCSEEIDDGESMEKFPDVHFDCVSCEECLDEYFYTCELCRKHVCESCGGNPLYDEWYYCSDCISPDIVEKHMKEHISEIQYDALHKYLEKTKSMRRELLIKCLNAHGVKFRGDSKLCKRYIDCDDVELDFVELIEGKG